MEEVNDSIYCNQKLFPNTILSFFKDLIRHTRNTLFVPIYCIFITYKCILNSFVNKHIYGSKDDPINKARKGY